MGERRTSIPPARADSHKARSATRAAEVSFMMIYEGKTSDLFRVQGLIRLGIDKGNTRSGKDALPLWMRGCGGGYLLGWKDRMGERTDGHCRG